MSFNFLHRFQYVDNVPITAGSGTSIATDDIGGVQYQRTKLVWGIDGVATDASATNPIPVVQTDAELGNAVGMTALRDLTTAMRYTTWGDSIADGVSAEWVQTNANGGTTTATGGEGLLQTSANAIGSAQIVGPVINYFPGQVDWVNSAARLGDLGNIGNTRRWGRFTISAGVPQDGFAFELIDTIFYATSFKGGVATRIASTAWTKFATAPYTLDLIYMGAEIRFTANSAAFYINHVLRHTASGGATSITNTLNLPIAAQNVNTSGATNRILSIRNIGQGRFGTPPDGTVGHDLVDFGNPLKIGGRAQSTAPTAVAEGDRVNAWFDLNGNLRVAGAFFQATQPVSGTFFQATQPVSLATNTPDVTDRAARLLGVIASITNALPAGTNALGNINELRASTLAVTVTAATGVAATLTLPAVVGQFHYITSLQIRIYATAARVGAATPVLVTTTNLPGSPVFTFETAQAIGTNTPVQGFDTTTPVKSSVVNTATTIVAPIATTGIWRITATYFTAV